VTQATRSAFTQTILTKDSSTHISIV